MEHPQPTARAVFDHAIELALPSQRDAYVAQACADNAALRQKVDALLKAYEAAGDFLESPDPQLNQNATLDDSPLPIREGPGSVIGRYKLLERIGEGGFGIVFMAEQQHPVRRKVALKIIKPGMDTKQVIARFEAERQALALMDHPNIARVFDAGATDAGRPYFVMELVRGVPVTEYCDANNLTPRQRFELFIQVCHAVQHAHQKGIIHRDLKPTNVLVTLHDGIAMPKVIDFGIAKATGQQLTERTLFTNFAQMVGTPLYMSPEQAQMSATDVDTRSDIYSLGVLLYELLTGTTPFDKERMKHAAFDELRRIIREEEPPRPSTRLSTLGQAATFVSAHRRMDAKRLGQLMRGELDWVVMKALEKDRTRRYETANGLAKDVERYLKDEPVTARPATAVYRLTKFASRHKAGAAATLGIALALVLGVVGTTIGMVHARSARNAADAQKNVALGLLDDVKREKAAAQKHAQRAEAANEFLRNMLTAARPSTRPIGQEESPLVPSGMDVKLIDVLAHGEQLLDSLHDQPELELDVRLNLARTYEALMKDPTPHYERALALSRTLAGETAEQTLQIATDLAFSLRESDPKRALALARPTAEAVERLFGPRHALTFDAFNSVALALGSGGDVDGEEKLLNDLVQRVRENPGIHHPKGAARYLNNLALTLTRRGDRARSTALQEEATRLAASEPHTLPYRALLYQATLAGTLWKQGKTDESAELWRKVYEARKRQFGIRHQATHQAQGPLVTTLQQLGRYADAAPLGKEILASLTPAGRDLSWEYQLNMAETQLRAGKLDEARASFAEALDAIGRQLKSDPKREEVSRDRRTRANLQLGLRPGRPWTSPALQSHIHLAAWSAATSHWWAAPPPKIQWEQLRFTLRPWTRPARPASAGTPPATAPAVIEGDAARLAALADPLPGLYRLSVVVPRDGTFAMHRGSWLLRSNWDLSLFRVNTDEVPGDDTQWDALFAQAPAEIRRELSLAFLRTGFMNCGFGPHGRLHSYALSAKTTLNLPPGRYGLRIDHDGGCRAWVDGEKVYDGWTAKQDKPANLEFTGLPRKLEVRWVRGVNQLCVCLEPDHPDVAALLASERPPFYDLDTSIERLTAQASRPGAPFLTVGQLAQSLARRGRLSEADEAFVRTIALVPDNSWNYAARAILSAYGGDREAHEKLCREMLARFGSTGNESGERIAKAWLLLADTGYDLQTLHRQIDDAIKKGAPAYLGWYKMAKGLAEYRSGKHESALRWLDDATSLRPPAVAVAMIDYLTALSLHRLGRLDEARSSFLVTETAWRQEIPNVGEGPIPNVDCFAVEVLRREAAAVFPRPPEGWRFEQLGGAAAVFDVDGQTIVANVTKVDAVERHVQVTRAVGALGEGRQYTVRFKARADAERLLKVVPTAEGGDHNSLSLPKHVKLTDQWQEMEYTFTAKDVALDGRNRFTFQMGQQTGMVWIKDFSIAPPPGR